MKSTKLRIKPVLEPKTGLYKCPFKSCRYRHKMARVVGTHYARKHVAEWSKEWAEHISEGQLKKKGSNKKEERIPHASIEADQTKLQTVAAYVGGQIIQIVRDTARATDCNPRQLAAQIRAVLDVETGR